MVWSQKFRLTLAPAIQNCLSSDSGFTALAVRNILKLTLSLRNTLFNLYSATTFNNSNSPNCCLPKLALWTIVTWFITCTRLCLLLMSLKYVSASLAALRFRKYLVSFYSTTLTWLKSYAVGCRLGANGAPAAGIQRQGGIQRVKLQKWKCCN